MSKDANTYTIEYSVHGGTGKRIKIGSDLGYMLYYIMKAGCRINHADIMKAWAWADYACDGERLLLGRCACEIRKGERNMTGYTSY